MMVKSRVHETSFPIPAYWGHDEKLKYSFFPGSKYDQFLDRLKCTLYFKYVSRTELARSESILYIFYMYMNAYPVFGTSLSALLFFSLSKFENLQCNPKKKNKQKRTTTKRQAQQYNAYEKLSSQ